jgi:uncharacterized protein YjbI with pentapeptide repeats
MPKANLFKAHLEDADSVGAILKEAILAEIRLNEASLAQANLHRVNLSVAKGLNLAQINSAFTDEETKLPLDFQPQ